MRYNNTYDCMGRTDVVVYRWLEAVLLSGAGSVSIGGGLFFNRTAYKNAICAVSADFGRYY